MNKQKQHTNVLGFLAGSLWLATNEAMNSVEVIVQSVLDGKNPELRQAFLDAQMAEAPAKDDSLNRAGVTIENGIATIPITGMIMPKATLFSAYSGGTDIQTLTANVKKLSARDDVHTLFFLIDSDGGNVHGIETAAEVIRSVRGKKRTIALAEHSANSAAYWLGSAAETFLVTPTAVVGSIGVVVQMQFADEETQKRTVILRSTPRKADMNRYEPLSDDARNDILSDLSTLHESFVKGISLNRKISMEKANKLADGTTERGAEAVARGLADGVVPDAAAVIEQITAMEDAEGRFTALTEAYQNSEAARTQLSAELAEIRTQLASVNQAQADAAAEALEQSYVAAVDTAITEGRVASTSREDTLADLRSGDMSLKSFQKIVSNISAGTFVPQESVEPNGQTETANPNKPANETEKRMFRSLGLNVD